MGPSSSALLRDLASPRPSVHDSTMQVLANIDVDDLSKATVFYCTALDLKIGRRFGTSGVELLGASSLLYLLEKPAGSAATPHSQDRRDYSRHWTPVHLDFVVPDLDTALQRA